MGLSDRRYSQHARRTLIRARRLAREFYHPVVETDHVILGMLRTENSIGYRVLSEFRIDQIRAESIVRGLYAYQFSHRTDLPSFSRNLQSVLLYAADEAYWLGSHYIGTEHILLGLVRSGTGQLSNLLLQLQISSHEVRHRIRHVLSEGAYETNLDAARRSARLSELSRRVLNAAARLAEENTHKAAGLEHLLLVLSRERRSMATQLLLECGLNQEQLAADIHATQSDAILAATGLDEVLARAVYQTEKLGTHYTGTDHILLAMTLDDEAISLMEQYGVQVARLQEKLQAIFNRT